MANTPIDAISDVAKAASSAVAKAGGAAGKAIIDAGGKAVDAASAMKDMASNITIEDVLREAMKIPGVKINREKFLRDQLKDKFPEDVVSLAIKHNPAYAGIGRNDIAKIAKNSIGVEAAAVSAISFGAGLPGGAAMAISIPADLAQYYAGVLRIMQKLAYLYGFDEFDFKESSVSDETMNEVILFLGVMSGVQGANQAVAKLAESMAQKAAKEIMSQALTKTTWYPILKKVAKAVGVKLTKQILADGVSKAVPIVGGVISGGVTLASFAPSANRLKNHFRELPISDPEFYRSQDIVVEAVEDVADEALTETAEILEVETADAEE